ncbi:hypothetical protein HH_0958 [Helicobacter hepaticus ATCC 51449]|uniref:Uncharacterized protein n=1 Tax=Helicobacter hepaticus (strain ATCC 51449 / 3B1) TaxID=235279 RepID=Q7VHK9_HELHP|nr:hypothetical protein HH_0958 [Helicobacter hepaticus ATCC 51449]
MNKILNAITPTTLFFIFSPYDKSKNSNMNLKSVSLIKSFTYLKRTPHI